MAIGKRPRRSIGKGHIRLGYLLLFGYTQTGYCSQSRIEPIIGVEDVSRTLELSRLTSSTLTEARPRPGFCLATQWSRISTTEVFGVCEYRGTTLFKGRSL